MNLSGVYAITDSQLLPGDRLIASITQALEGGISLLQYRDKTADRATALAQASALVELCAGYDVPLLINDDVQLCLESGASGVHIGQSDSSVAAARSILGARAIIGVTCHASLEVAQQAQQAGADYVAFGRFFPSITKPDAPGADLDILRQARQVLSIPIVAIGGINAENAPLAITAGADMLAVINYLFADEHVLRRTQTLTKLF